MTKGRKTAPQAPLADDPTDYAAVKKAAQAFDQLAARSADIAERYGDGVAYDRERVVTEARYLMSQSAEAMLEAGKRLIQIKENEEFGEFTTIVEDRLGLGQRTARAMMQAAAKYLSPILESKRQTFAVLGKVKLFDLMVESDDNLADLAKGGTLAGHTIDEMQAMSVRELRSALADARQTLGAKDKVIAKRDAKISSLEEKATFETEELRQLAELNEAANACDLAFQRLGVVVGRVVDESDSEAMRKRALLTMSFMVHGMREVIERHALDVDASDEAIGAGPPPWLDIEALKGGAKARGGK